MALTREHYAGLYQREEYNPKGCCRFICLVASIILVLAGMYVFARYSGITRAEGQTIVKTYNQN